MMQEPAPLFLNCDFKICLRAHKLLGDLRETGPWLKTERHETLTNKRREINGSRWSFKHALKSVISRGCMKFNDSCRW